MVVALLGMLATLAASIYATNHILTRYLKISQDHATAFVAILGVVLGVTALYSWWLFYKGHMSGDNLYALKKMEKMAEFSPRDYRLLYWIFGLLLVPILAIIYSLPISLVIAVLIGLCDYHSSYRYINYAIVLSSFIAAIITYYKLGVAFVPKTE